MNRYTAYGLTIDSALPLPELPSAPHPGDADLVIRIGQVDWSPPSDGRQWSYFQVDGRQAYLYWSPVGKFVVRDGRDIIIDPHLEVEEAVIRLPLLGAVLAMALHQRGLFILHASAVAIQDRAAVFLGRKGQGKSTTAASLCSRGHKLMADDVAAIDLSRPHCPVLLPGFPQIKLWPEAAIAALGDNPETLRRVHPAVEKRARPIDRSHFLQQSLPLKRIYLLADSATARVKPTQSGEAVIKLIANSYIPSLLGEVFQQSSDTLLHFQQCVSLAHRQTVYTLERPRSLALLSDLAELIETDLTHDYSAARL